MCDECELRENRAVERIAKSLGFDIEVTTHEDGTVTVKNLAMVPPTKELEAAT